MVARVLQVFGFLIIIAGFFIGYRIGGLDINPDAAVVFMFAWIGSSIVSGLILVGLGEILHRM